MNTEMSDPFQSLFDDENQGLQVVKELFSDTNIDMKTELSDNEIKNLCAIHFLAKEFKISYLDNYIERLLRLRVSKARKGRAEFIQAVKKEESGEVKGFSKLLKSGKI